MKIEVIYFVYNFKKKEKMFIVIYAILLWIQNLNHRAMEINILQKQFKEQQIQLDVLKQTAYFPVYRNSLRGADGMQQYNAEELVLTGYNINMQAISQLKNLKRLRLISTMVAGYYKTDIDFGDISFPKLTELEIVPMDIGGTPDVNFTGNFGSVERLSIVISSWYAPRPLSYLEKIQKMQKLNLVSFYGDYYNGPDSICYLDVGVRRPDCLARVKYYHEIIKYCNENNISVTETDCWGNYKYKPLMNILNKMCQPQ